MNKVNLNTLKQRLPAVKQMIQSTLKVDAGTQSTYDIMAVANGHKNHHAVKALSQQPYYSVRANLGTEDEPFFVTKELGYFDMLSTAQSAMWDALKNCKKHLVWFLYEDEVKTGIRRETFTSPKRGLYMEATLTGDTQSDLELALEQIHQQVSQGYKSAMDSNDEGSYTFTVDGVDYDPIDEIDCVTAGEPYAIFDTNGIIESCDEEDEINAIWEQRDYEIESWSNALILGQNVSLEEALEALDDEIYHLVERNGKWLRGGEVSSLKQTLAQMQSEVSIYLELDRDTNS